MVALRSPRFFPYFFLANLCFQLIGATLTVVEEDSLLVLLRFPWVFAIPVFVFALAVSIANDRLPARFSTDGLRARGVRVFRYDFAARWEQIDRIWVDRQGMSMVLIRLRDPDAVAGADARLRRAMRRRRDRFSADLILPLFMMRPGTAVIGEAVERLSGGTHRLEHRGVDPVPNADDVVLENRFAMPAGVVLLLAISAPWCFIMFRVMALWPLQGRDLFTAIAWALVSTLVLALPLAASLIARMTPPILAPSGLRVRAANLFRYDARVPWDQVTGILPGRSGPFRRLLVSVRDPEALAGADRRLADRMRRNRERHGADLIVPVSATGSSDADLAGVITRLRQGVPETPRRRAEPEAPPPGPLRSGRMRDDRS